MSTMIDTLEFAERFESVGFDHDKAKVLAAAFGQTRESAREDLVTKDYLDTRFAQHDVRLAEMETRLVKAIAESAKESSGRLWSAIVIIAGMSTAISAAVATVSAKLIQ